MTDDFEILAEFATRSTLSPTSKTTKAIEKVYMNKVAAELIAKERINGA